MSVNGVKLGDLLKEHETLKEAASELEKTAKDFRRRQDAVRYSIIDYLGWTGSSSVTDDETKHRATLFVEEKWIVADEQELEAAVRESPALRHLLIETVDRARVLQEAKEDPDLWREIPGMMLLKTPKLRLTYAPRKEKK